MVSCIGTLTYIEHWKWKQSIYKLGVGGIGTQDEANTQLQFFNIYPE